jgi:hypothetical protein
MVAEFGDPEIPDEPVYTPAPTFSDDEDTPAVEPADEPDTTLDESPVMVDESATGERSFEADYEADAYVPDDEPADPVQEPEQTVETAIDMEAPTDEVQPAPAPADA